VEIVHQSKNAREPMPAGFTVVPGDDDAVIIHHKRTSMRAMNIFLTVWLIGWSVFCVVLVVKFLNGASMDDGEPVSLWKMLFFFLAEIVVACWLAYSLFCKQSFRIEAASLTVNTDVLGFKRTATIPRSSIRRIVQVKDGGEDDDSFPSWGLKVEGEKEVTLIYRQPYDKSHWLGGVLAKWAQVDFVEAPRDLSLFGLFS
jgi:hypothetical protein